MTASAPRLEILALEGVPDISEGDDLCRIVLDAYRTSGLAPAPGDILVVAQKIVSKAEGRQVELASVSPSAEAERLAAETEKDARAIELILSESDEVMRARPGLIVVRHRLGYVLANAGIDASNVEGGGDAHVLLLPRDPDRSAASLRAEIERRTGIAPGVIVGDSLGRAWRLGTTGTALGAAGVVALADLRGTPDMFGRPLTVSEVGLADQIASAAALAMGEADERRPIVLVRGLAAASEDSRAADLIRPREFDLFP
ncbi:MAG: coenzyme F420-0:L-glutamate ligase [Defluviicoccus sp.]|nr:coenzyme F420-0:L-glutamate ligase [Defluviicoccus sp.]MDE0275702.1 coenzyme F420-0:L-glutamate ligase [Defluviicoccus sp.]